MMKIGRKFERMKNIKLLAFVAVLILIIFAHTLYVNKFATSQVEALTDQEAAELSAKLKEAQKKLEDIKNQKKQVNDKIAQEGQNQTKLTNDSKYLNSVIEKNKLQVQSLDLEVQQLEVELDILEKEQETAANRLAELIAKEETLNQEQIAASNLLLKLSMDSISLVDSPIQTEESQVENEKVKYLIQLITSNKEEIVVLKAEVQTSKDAIDAKKKEVEAKQSERKAQSENLKAQQEGLAWQVENKAKLLQQSQQSKLDLQQQDLTLNQQMAEYQQKLDDLRKALYVAAPSGTRVTTNSIIGFQGRTGLSCGWISDTSKKTNNYCQQYAGLSQNYYYYDPVAYPTTGSHLHFEYYKGGKRVDPNKYLTSPKEYPDFQRMPMDKFSITGGFNGRHQANDLSGGHGTPVHPVKPGTVMYYCDSWFPVDPAYGAVVYHDDGTITQYWHLQRKSNSPPCKKL